MTPFTCTGCGAPWRPESHIPGHTKCCPDCDHTEPDAATDDLAGRSEMPAPVRSTHTMTFTYTVVHYANPFLVCEVCGAKVDGYIDAPGRELHFHSHPCRHMPIRSTCHSWGPVDGCRCRKRCEVPS